MTSDDNENYKMASVCKESAVIFSKRLGMEEMRQCMGNSVRMQESRTRFVIGASRKSSKNSNCVIAYFPCFGEKF